MLEGGGAGDGRGQRGLGEEEVKEEVKEEAGKRINTGDNDDE